MIAPFMPVEFTSILTATVWSFSGDGYALAFVIFGTFFRLDSISVYSGVEDLLMKVFRIPAGEPAAVSAIAVMFVGNVVTAYLFKTLIRRKMAGRVPGIYLTHKGEFRVGLVVRYSVALLGRANRGARRVEAALGRVRLGARG